MTDYLTTDTLPSGKVKARTHGATGERTLTYTPDPTLSADDPRNEAHAHRMAAYKLAARLHGIGRFTISQRSVHGGRRNGYRSAEWAIHSQEGAG